MSPANRSRIESTNVEHQAGLRSVLDRSSGSIDHDNGPNVEKVGLGFQPDFLYRIAEFRKNGKLL
jgi:hypothetical protein